MGKIKIGWGIKSITPDKPLDLQGQFYSRITSVVRDPLMVTVLAMEGSSGGDSVAVIVSCDLIAIDKQLRNGVSDKIKQRIPDLDPQYIILNATHTHTGPKLPFMMDWGWPRLYLPEENPEVMTADAYSEFAIERIADAIEEAWNNRKEGALSWGEGYAAIAHNRRVLYDDGSATMYGKVNNTHFRGFDGPEDPRVEMMYSWNNDRELTGIVLNVACTAQIIENESVISADYVGELRAMIKEKWGPHLSVLVMIGAAGDLAPRDLLRKDRSPRSLDDQLRQTAQTLMNAIETGLVSARDQLEDQPVIKHKVKQLELPIRRVTKIETDEASKAWEAFRVKQDEQEDPNTNFQSLHATKKMEIYNCVAVRIRYELMQKNPFYTMELHTLRMGNTVLVTNPFELFTDYGIQLKARSAAKQTFVAQLSCDAGGYLPTSKAITSGGYSTQIYSGIIGDDGGRLLVDYTISSIQELWGESEVSKTL
jgi:hypothetical protein